MRNFEHKIKKLQFRQNLIIGLKFALIALAIFILAFTLFFVVFSSAAKHVQELFLFALTIKILLFLIFIYLALQANRTMKTKLEIARQLDEFNQDKADTYQNALELQAEDIEHEILERILQKADRKAENQLLKVVSNFLSPIWKIVILLYLASALLFILNPQKFMQAREFFAMRKMPEIQHKEFVELEPGNISVTRNSKVTIEILNPEPEVEHKFFYRIEDNWRQEQLMDYKKIFENLDFSFSYFVQTPFAVSDTFRVEVFELPVVTNIDVRYDYPEYTKLKSEFEQNASGNIRAIQGTQITLNIDANNPIENGKIIFSTGDLQDLTRTGKSSFKTDFKVEQNGSYHFNLEDILGNTSRKLSKSITVVYDQIPEIKITYPGKDTLFTQNMLLPLQIIASDDFGLKDLLLFYHINQGVIDSLSLQSRIPGTTLSLDHVFDMNEMVLFPGDKVTYWVQISDNSPQKQTAESRRFTARFPSIEEIYKEIEEKEQEKREVLENTLEKSQELQEEFEEKRRELLKKEEMDWEDKKDIENILDKQENLNKDIENVAEDFQELLEKFEDNEGLSNDTMEKMQRIQELMEEISNEELEKAMEKLRESMENLDPDVMKKALEDFKFSMEDFSKKLDQTIKLLEDIKKEQAIEKALEITEEMNEMQSTLNEKTKSGESSNEELSKQQKQISDKMDSLQKQLDEIEKMLGEKDGELQKMLDELREQMEKDDVQQDMQQSSENLQSGEMKKAQQSQQSAQEKLEQMMKMLQKMKESFAAGAQMNMMQAMQTAVRRLLIFSERHEASHSKYFQDPFAILPDQIAIFESVNLTVNELLQTPMIALTLGAKFFYDANFTSSTYREMFQYINDAQHVKVNQFLTDVQKGLNLMIYDLLQSSQNMQQGGSSSGMQSLMQALQQMGQQQMMINMVSQQLLQQLGKEGRMSQEMMSQAQRLARDEERLAENLKRILQNDREAQKQTNAINQIIDDLEEIAHDLKRGRIDRNLVDKQERILSRLLDAQKSIHKREFSKKRKAEQSEIENWELPEEIKLEFDKMRKKALLNEDLEDYPKEYRELIKEYLRLLNEKAE
ncbi:MAG: hypothetical protein K9N09_03080 [Candidatus Cloacimonetes bacterium]|nr:hypothetical protein [Candidatus Cloacimonadota bacterium]MCF7814811.1 hypothetical protein [Candidatus Cloacimonadota bacterium]MCF7867659.1 hypothetical protein [Candidatus Cloacimonadota bacterium]MCF7883543.1 hypothetical protein [Candidatus Cloacimonadota bacterium]